MSSCTSTSCSNPQPERTTGDAPIGHGIRAFRKGDADALAALARRAILTIGPRAYLPAQVTAWAARIGPELFLARANEDQTLLVAADEHDRPCAYAILESDGHLDHLYCDPDHTRRGLAQRLLAHAEHVAHAAGATRLHTEASELARPAFERAGYRVTHRRDFAIEHAGKHVPIHNSAMEKLLA